jgi:thioredoxin-related protein
MLPKLTNRAAPAGFLPALSILFAAVVSGCNSDIPAADTGAPEAQQVALQESGPRDPREFFFTQTFGDLPEEMGVARKQGKLGMLLFFEAEACSFCQSMLKTVFSDRRVQEWYQQRFVSIAIDIHGDVELMDFDGITLPSKVFAEHRRVFLTPVVSILNLDGIEIHRQLGMVKTPEEFLLLGEYIEGKHYFDTEFDVFYEQQLQQSPGEILTTPHESSASSGENL